MRRAEPFPERPDVPDFANRVLDVAEAIPPGRVMSYGDVAEYLGQGGPRQVGRAMALWGGGVCPRMPSDVLKTQGATGDLAFCA